MSTPFTSTSGANHHHPGVLTMPFDYNACALAARTWGPDGLLMFPSFTDDGGDLALVLRDLAHLAGLGHQDAATAAFALVALAEQLDEKAAR